MKYRIEHLQSVHDRAPFDCGRDPLNTYLKRFAKQNQRKGIGQTYVALPADSSRVVGFYTLSAGSVRFQDLPSALRKGIPRYPVPIVHLGRLAVCQSAQGQGLGSALLVDAMKRTVATSRSIGIAGIGVIAKDDEARAFYQKYGFTPMVDETRHLFLPLATAMKALAPDT